MLLSSSSAELLASLPAVIGDVSAYLVDETGSVEHVGGPDDGTRITPVDSHDVDVRAGAGRTAMRQSLGLGEGQVVLTFPEKNREVAEPFLVQLVAALIEKDQFEEDMESINASSLALLEEVALVGDTLPRLPTGRSDFEVAEMGLKALVVGASLERAIFVQFHSGSDSCRVLAQVGMDAEGHRAEAIPFDGPTEIEPDDGLVWRALRGNGDAILETVPENGQLGVEGSVERLAHEAVIAVPVRYGDEREPVTLGVLIVIDKRPTAYTVTRNLGSHETKLATGLASMLGSVLGVRTVVELDKELRLANEIQQQILPDLPAEIAGFELAGRCVNSGAVGGDYFDYLAMADGRVLTVVADVSGHNLASGMVMVSVRATLRTLAARATDVSQVFDEVASTLYGDLFRSERFLTAVGIGLRAADPEVHLINAGHNDTMIYRAETGRVERLASADTVLGFLSAPRHTLTKARLDPGDVLLVYTDGITEATDPNGVMFEEERLEETLRSTAAGQPAEILDAVYSAVATFSETSKQEDDITAVVIKACPVEERS